MSDANQQTELSSTVTDAPEMIANAGELVQDDVHEMPTRVLELAKEGFFNDDNDLEIHITIREAGYVISARGMKNLRAAYAEDGYGSEPEPSPEIGGEFQEPPSSWPWAFMWVGIAFAVAYALVNTQRYGC